MNDTTNNTNEALKGCWPGGPTVAFSKSTKQSTVDMFAPRGVTYKISAPPAGFVAKGKPYDGPCLKPMVDEDEFATFIVEGF